MNPMPVNKRESLIYTFLMVFVMAGVMTTYNIAIHSGLSLLTIQKAWLVFPITFIIAFIVEWFFVSKIAMTLIEKIVKENESLIKKILVSALCFVSQMVVLMSFIGSLIFNEFDAHWISELLISIPRNFIMAYPLQVLFAGPLVGFIFRKLFPLGTIVDPV